GTIMKRRDLIATALAAPHVLIAGCASPASSNASGSADPTKAQITVLYDAFGRDPALQKDWGFAAFIEIGGKRILFDTGNNAKEGFGVYGADLPSAFYRKDEALPAEQRYYDGK